MYLWIRLTAIARQAYLEVLSVSTGARPIRIRFIQSEMILCPELSIFAAGQTG